MKKNRKVLKKTSLIDTNRSKGAKDPAQWMPKNEAFHCEYIKKWVAVKEKVMLYMDRNEQQKINRVLAGLETCVLNILYPLIMHQ